MAFEITVPLANGVDCFDTFQALRTANPQATHGAVFVRGRNAVGDGAEGLFFWDAAETRADNGMTILAPTSGSGRWKRAGGNVSAVTPSTALNRCDTNVLNVRWFGAKGDGYANDTAAIQEALNYVRCLAADGQTVNKPGAATLYFPPGRYHVDATLDAGRAVGVRYQGAAVSRRAKSWSTDAPHPQHPSVLVWVGGGNHTVLFKWSGNYCVFDSLVFQGGYDNAPTPPAIGFLLNHDTTGLEEGQELSAGKGWFPNIQFNHCFVGFQCAQTASYNGVDPTPGCDTCSFGRFGARDCGTGFKVVSDQGQGYVFEYSKFDDCTTCFDFERGGAVDVQHVHVVRCSTILRIQHGAPNTNYFRIGSVLIDGETTTAVVWVKHTTDPAFPAYDTGNISIESGVSAGKNQGGSGSPAAFQLSGRAVLSVRNVAGGIVDENLGTAPRRLFEMSTVDSPRTCTAVFENCGLNSLDPENAGHTIGALRGPGKMRWQLRNCYRTTNHVRIPDYGNLNGSRVGTKSFNGSSFADVTHGLFGANLPLLDNSVVPRIFVTPQDQSTLWVTNVTTTGFRVNRASSSSASFFWRAEVGP